MNDFDQRWRTLARQTHGLKDDDLSAELPFGFATRTLARCQQSPAEPLEDILNAFGLRALFVTMAIGLVSAGLVFSDWYDFRIERPKLEQTMTSELSWP
jgi:hypothetical protein